MTYTDSIKDISRVPVSLFTLEDPKLLPSFLHKKREVFFYNHGQTGGVEDGRSGEGGERARGTRRVASVGTAIYLPPLCKILEPRSAPWESSLGKRQN